MAVVGPQPPRDPGEWSGPCSSRPGEKIAGAPISHRVCCVVPGNGWSMRDTCVMDQRERVPDRNPTRRGRAEESHLVQALRRDDPSAVELLVDRYGDRVYGLALRITGVKEDAEAVTENVLPRAVRDIQSATTDAALAARI